MISLELKKTMTSSIELYSNDIIITSLEVQSNDIIITSLELHNHLSLEYSREVIISKEDC